MPAIVQLYPEWPRTTLRLAVPMNVTHTMRVLLKHGGRFVECSPEVISYPEGDITFTVHHFVDGDRAFNLFADSHGWALLDKVVMKLVQEGVLLSDETP